MKSSQKKTLCGDTTHVMGSKINELLLLGILSFFVLANTYSVEFAVNSNSQLIPGLSELYFLETHSQNASTTELLENKTNAEQSLSPQLYINISSKTAICNPPFKIFRNILKQEDRESIRNYVHNKGLGPDPSSLHFIEREKNIRFIRVEDGNFIPLERDYFIQPENYNDFSGGHKRHYKVIPSDILKGPMHSVILHFIQYHHLPINTTILVQLQSSIIRANSTKGDVTGQGIHTDGADDAMLVCVERDDVIGAENEFHAALDGSQPLTKPIMLDAGDGVVFRDNQIFHYVSDAKTNVPVTRRTLILMHSPEEGNGITNPRNNQGTRKATIQLRNQ